MKPSWFAAPAVLALLVAGCPGREAQAPEILGEVNNEYLTTDEFMHQLKVRGGAGLRGEARRDFKRWLLAELVDRKLMLQEARRRGIRQSRDEVKVQVEEMGRRGWQEAERAQVQNVEDELWEQRLIEVLLRREIRPVRDPSPREVARRVREHPEEFLRPEQIRLRQIVVHSAAMVRKAQKMLADGESFEEAAARLGGAPKASLMGPAWVSREDVPEGVWEAVAGSQKGSLNGPVATEYGFHLVRMEGRRKAGALPPDEAEKRARRSMLDERRREAVQEWLARVRKASVIRVDLSAVDRL